MPVTVSRWWPGDYHLTGHARWIHHVTVANGELREGQDRHLPVSERLRKAQGNRSTRSLARELAELNDADVASWLRTLNRYRSPKTRRIEPENRQKLARVLPIEAGYLKTYPLVDEEELDEVREAVDHLRRATKTLEQLSRRLAGE